MTAKSIVLASGNKGKIKELDALLAPMGWHVRAQSEWDFVEAEETGLSFVENAIIKARHACAQTGLPALADDSGLAVDALQGAPGIYSARYAGAQASDSDNIAKLLEAMAEVPEHARSARFICALVFMQHANDPTPIICQGQWEGQILTAPQGNGGFGYDPVFFSPEKQCSAAELSAEDKQMLSHRGKALAQLRRLL
ncbi:RdgB/HAM1 family non-canonical purine NTP pyrophosphatase [Aliidiomarina maris]|uniref:dITP/XTP pyrophosphatase n=1 Tax=Aliidiomarina maris TaxID=531312 RepID=A0A327WZ16_9GAMM|nr:RdgB/HAM1 family non-canonical purine NTP pyrophosphatase [Aliidiomarina maris]MBA3987820.1 non-canonical purine NTP pyrophosphatase, RdgB/HAM1 family [Idiomarina sp.]MCL5051236.1 RdgB/HAM1 family non-canonical purine NTP pyrophosphatase [Bacillota bacterium]RAJ95229.1 XTP/dITP diphosphohydrolase [Aliidiomarina maris]RUO21073.1 non-canonical purine NTP pyrophosphatase, RdgB/HAM1 family [Aliidiomarina maris]